MKVLFLTDGIYPFKIGGMQKHSTILTDLLLKKGVAVTLVHPGGDTYKKEAFKELFGGSDAIDEIRLHFPKRDPLPGHYIRENKEYSKQIYLKVQDRINEFDIIYAQGFTAWHFLKNKEKGRLMVPIFVNFHGYEMFQRPPSLRVRAEYVLFRKSVKWMVKTADYVYSFGSKIDDVLKAQGVKAEQLILQSNGIRKEWLRDEISSSEGMQFVFIGRHERRKGIEELNRALLELKRKKELQFSFHFIGPIPDEARISDRRLTYHGELRDAEKIKAVLDSSDCLVCPSHSEGMPTVILEAMARGLAIIGTNVGAVSRQIDGNGILLEQPLPLDLEEALIKMIQMEKSELDILKHRSLKLVEEKFLWEVIADQKIANFKKVLVNS
jgi:glycosyltransferase involved in cell wall biosynthesis